MIVDRRRRWRAPSERWIIAALALAAAVLFAIGLGQGTLWDQDEPRYAEAAREILETHDPVTLHINGIPWFVHPPLYIWLQALTGWLIGFSEASIRLWSAIFGVIGIVLTYRVGRMFFSVRATTLGAIALMTMIQYYVQSRLGIFDGALLVFMLAAFLAYVRSLRESSPRLAVWAFAWAGLGTLTKGPIALLLPALVAMAWLWRRREWHRWREIPWPAGLLAYAVIAVPWYAIETVRHGLPFLERVIGYYTVTRFVGVVEGQSGPWWYYGPVLLLGAFPWSGFLLVALADQVRRWRDDGSALIILWCSITLAFYTVAGTKLPNYILPVYPLAALAIGVTWDRALASDGRARQSLSAAFALTGLLVVAIAWGIRAFGTAHYPADYAAIQDHLLQIAKGIVLGLLLATACYYVLRRPIAAFAVLAGGVVVLAGTLTYRTIPLLDAHRPIKRIAAAAQAQLQPGDTLIGVRLAAQQTLMFYAHHRVEWVEDRQALAAAVCQSPRAVVVTPSVEYTTWVSRALGTRSRVLADADGLTAVLVERDAPCDPSTQR